MWLLRAGSMLPAAVVLLGAGGFAWGLRQLLPTAPAAPAKLLLRPEGWMVLHANGTTVAVYPAPCSLRLGRYILLLLHDPAGRRLRLLLGPGILSASDLAALARWLAGAGRRGNGAGGTAVDSHPGHQSGLF